MMHAILTYGLACAPLVILVVLVWAIGNDPQYVPMTPTEERDYLRQQGMSDTEIDELIAFSERHPR